MIIALIHLVTGIILSGFIILILCCKVKKVDDPEKLVNQYRAFIYDGIKIIS